MKTMCRLDLRRLTTRAVAALLVVSGAAACSLENQEQPALSGPSELGLSITMAASPDQLPRDGSSQSVITLTARDPQGKPIAGQRLTLSLPVNSPAGAALSATDVVTNAGGQATFAVTAPAAGSLGNITIFAVPFGTDSNNASTRTIAITALPLNSTVPVASFIFTPNAPEVGQVVTFNASGTQDEGRTCTDQCTFVWDFGDEGTVVGRIVGHTFLSGGSHLVTLTVTDGAQSVGRSERVVTISAPGPPTVDFTVPTGIVAGQPATFTATTTQAPNHRIVSYSWSWGDGASNTTTASTIQHTFDKDGRFIVTLSVRDDLGQSSSVTKPVVVSSGLVASFTMSPTAPRVGQAVSFDASASFSNTGTAIVNYAFDFGDGATQSGSSPTATHPYAAAGSYLVKLTITDDKGRTAFTTTPSNAAAGNVTVIP